MNILDIEVPLIAAVNGPVRLHSEYILLADIVTPTTVFQDKPHFELGVASGDGVHLLWQEAVGSIRGRYFIMTRQGDIAMALGVCRWRTRKQISPWVINGELRNLEIASWRNRVGRASASEQSGRGAASQARLGAREEVRTRQDKAMNS
jgi:hypothetical protein